MSNNARDPLPYLGLCSASAVPPVMNAVEAAKHLKMHTKTVCRLAREGTIPAKKVGNEWRFLKSVLDRWQDAQV